MKTARELRALRAAALKEAKALSDKGRLNPADQRKFDGLMAEAAELKTQYESVESRGAPPNGRPDGDQRESSRDEERTIAFRNYLRHGAAKMEPEQRSLLMEHRDMGSGNQGAFPGATSGFFVPVGFTDKIVETLKTYGPLLDPAVVELMDTSTGQVLPYPSENDTSIIGERVGEGQQVSVSDVALGQVLFNAWKYSSKLVKVSVELMQDSAFDFESFLTKQFAIRLARILVSDFTLGAGTASQQPLGIVTATLANGTLVPAVGAGANDGVSLPNSVGSDDLVNLEHGVDPLYRTGACYMMHDRTLQAIRRVKDKFGRPLFEPSLIEGAPALFNGYKVLPPNNFMDVLQTVPSSPPLTRNTVVFGSFKRFVVRRVREMSILRLEERFADYGQVGFLAFCRYDSSPLFGPNATGQQFPFAMLQNTY